MRRRPPHIDSVPAGAATRVVERVEGLNPEDPGIAQLGGALAVADPRDVLLVHTGDIPGLRRGATRLILDVRESSVHHRLVPAAVDPAAEVVPEVGHAAVWPRAHLGKDFALRCLARGAMALREGGSLWCAVRTTKGADSLADFMAELCGSVDTLDRDRRYHLLRAVRGPSFGNTVAARALARGYTITDPVLEGLALVSAPGVFSRDELDAGTRCLLEHVRERNVATPARVLDLGAGLGALGLWAAQRYGSEVLAVDTNLLAVELARHNARIHGLADRVHVHAADGFPEAAASWRGAVDLALVNPPTHADPATLARLVADALGALCPQGRAVFVVSRASVLEAPLADHRERVRTYAAGRYTVVEVDAPA